jgi:hypothetical protein
MAPISKVNFFVFFCKVEPKLYKEKCFQTTMSHCQECIKISFVLDQQQARYIYFVERKIN